VKFLLKVVGYFLASLVALVLCAWLFIELTWKKNYAKLQLPEIHASSDPGVIAQGDYLVHAVSHCSICHEPAEQFKALQPGSTDPGGADLIGGHEWQAGPFGTFHAANITPDSETGIGGLSDGELARVIRQGVRKDGSQAVFMSFVVGPMADEDLTAIISYLRTLPPMKHDNPKDELGLAGKLVMKLFEPRSDPAPQWAPPGGISIERGRYLANGPAWCVGCHTAADPFKGMKFTGAPLSGNPEAEPDPTDPDFEFVEPNLTPDPETGHITQWTEDAFVARFKVGAVFKGTKMPWPNFAHMTEDDVRSIFRYLRSLPPTKNYIGPTRRPKGGKAQ